jgi:hypothetical protein
MVRSSGAAGSRHTRPATTPEGRESQLISLASDVAEKQMRDGSASAQVITHYLKLGSSREKLEQERLQQENLMTQAKIEQIASQGRTEEMFANAIAAFQRYSGKDSQEDEIPEEYR